MVTPNKLKAPEAVPDIIIKLVDRFDAQRATYMSGSYNETQVRRDFIDPFFKALGWDIDNENDYAEAYRDVIHEDIVLVGNAKKAPDYSFRVGGVRKFFVEAKKPSVSIKIDPRPAFQLRRYGWSAKLPLSIVTDFEEFAVYDCTHKPDESHGPQKARLCYFKYTEYLERWNEIAALFSKQAVLKGSFDRFATAKKKGTTTVDEEFLAEIEKWRQWLASDIVHNNEISQRDLNLAVQLTIDRIIFLRICEDRGIEDYERLFKLSKASGIYNRLANVFKDADDRYNSGLFHFNTKDKHATEADTITLKLKISDAVLKRVIESLYPPNPYEFSVIPADILGHVYERFLGKVIHIAEKKATIEEKPEVKKAGGVFYTPGYIVEFIVKNTVDRLLEGKTPKQVEKLKIVDPACGSGSFLIVAYQHLLDWHLTYYMANGGLKKFKKELQQTDKGAHRLTTQLRKSILLNNIYGVDIDAQAVEVTKLSLLLKVLEGENGETLGTTRRLFHERALPDLGSNIKCGNSLIGSKFYEQENLPELSDDDHYRINAFEWTDEFPDFSKNGYFDVVIGNPPYVQLEGERRDTLTRNFLVTNYKTGGFKTDLYPVFIEKALLLVKAKGAFSFIIPSNFATNNSSAPLRRLLVSSNRLSRFDVLQYKVFEKASVDTAIVLVEPATCEAFSMNYIGDSSLTSKKAVSLNAADILKDPTAVFSMHGCNNSVINKMAAHKQLKDFAYVNFGKQLRDRKKFATDVIELAEVTALPRGYAKCYTGKNIQRYKVSWSGLACMTSREAQSGGCWDDDRQNAKDKILCKQVGLHPTFGIDTLGYQGLNTLFMVNLFTDDMSPYALLGILNSKATRYFWLNKYYDHRVTFPKIKGTYLKELPIPPLSKAAHDKIDRLTKEVTSLLSKVKVSRSDELRIKAAESQIDEAVNQAFSLTIEEIALVES